MKKILRSHLLLCTSLFWISQVGHAHGDGGLFAVIFSSSYAAAGITTTADATDGHHHYHYGHRHYHHHWKKEAKRTLNEIKIFKENGEISEALAIKVKALDKAESGRYQKLSTKKKIKLIKIVMEAVLVDTND